jgi:hypothetical protein
MGRELRFAHLARAFFWPLVGAAILCAAQACSLNPQPLPPGETTDAGTEVPVGPGGAGGGTSGNGGNSGSGSSGGSGSSSGGLGIGSSSGSSASGGGAPVGGHTDAGVADASAGPGDDAGAEGVDAGASVPDANPSDGSSLDGGVLGDGAPPAEAGALGCSADPRADHECARAHKPPHLYRCVEPYVRPSRCEVLSIGNRTDMYCCP